MGTVHVKKYGTYHPSPSEEVAWTVNDTRGYTDPGPSCDECGGCECFTVRECSNNGCDVCRVALMGLDASLSIHARGTEKSCVWHEDSECIGLSFSFVCLDGGDSLCERCAEKAGIEIVPCDCE